MRTRITDDKGGIIQEPQGYHTVKEAGENLLDDMERKGIDRADMLVVLQGLSDELMFHWRFRLDDRKTV